MTKSQTIKIPIEYKRLFDDDWREAAIYGGRYSLKSHTVARVLLIRAREKKRRIACFRELQNSIADSSHQLLRELIAKYKLNDFKVIDNSIINTVNGSDFIFRGLRHNEQSIKSIEGIDIAWCEEAQSISQQSIEILTPTVRKPNSQIIYTYNRFLEDDPVHQRLVVEGRPNTLIINANYDIAIKYGYMPDVIMKEIEDDKEKRPLIYKYKWLGEPNSSEDRVYKEWLKIEEIPHEAKLFRYGLDFGFSNDPAALVAVYQYNGAYIFDQLLYRIGLSNKMIADYIRNLAPALTKADSQEPKSIKEIANYGVPIIGARKGKDSVNYGIKYLQAQKIFITKRSVELMNEYKNYIWEKDTNGRVTNIPRDFDNHCLDACRYALDDVIERFTMQSLPKQNTGAYVLEVLRQQNVQPDSYYS